MDGVIDFIEGFRPAFERAGKGIDQNSLRQRDLFLFTGSMMDSMVLKLYKTSWAGDGDPLYAESRIFFSVWLSQKTLRQGRLCYNIHALKLRKLPGYSIESRVFAERFRTAFRPDSNRWPNVKMNMGPLTLMDGWTAFSAGNLERDVQQLANSFFGVDKIIDDTLASFRKNAKS